MNTFTQPNSHSDLIYENYWEIYVDFCFFGGIKIYHIYICVCLCSSICAHAKTYDKNILKINFSDVTCSECVRNDFIW